MDFLSNKFSIKWTFHKNKSPPSNYLYNRVVIGRILLQHRILKRPGILAAHRLRHHLLHQIVVALIEVARLPGPQTRLVRTTTTTTTNTTTSYSIISNYFKLFQIVSNYFKLFESISNYFIFIPFLTIAAIAVELAPQQPLPEPLLPLPRDLLPPRLLLRHLPFRLLMRRLLQTLDVTARHQRWIIAIKIKYKYITNYFKLWNWHYQLK